MAMFVVAAFVGALGQFLYKSGAERTDHSIASYLLNARLLGGVACYVAVMVLFVAAFKKGGALFEKDPVAFIKPALETYILTRVGKTVDKFLENLAAGFPLAGITVKMPITIRYT